MTQPSIFTSYDHPEFKLNNQQEAVVDGFRKFDNLTGRKWLTTYDFHGGYGTVNGKSVKIGDAGRRMRELREKGILESRKRGRYEEYRIITK